jgi:hypothetical protein
MGRAYSRHGGDEKWYKILLRNVKGQDHLESAGGRTVLK